MVMPLAPSPWSAVSSLTRVLAPSWWVDVKPLAVTPECVRLLAMGRVVPDLELIVGHAQRDVEDDADAEQDDRAGNGVPRDDEERADQLLAGLGGSAAVEDDARARYVRVEGREVRRGEEARKDAAEETLDGGRVVLSSTFCRSSRTSCGGLS
jgi:hypothetical protein